MDGCTVAYVCASGSSGNCLRHDLEYYVGSKYRNSGISDGQHSEWLLVDGSHRGVKMALTKERLTIWGFYVLATAYQSMHVNC